MNVCEQIFDYTIVCGKRNLYQLDLGYKVIDLTFCQLLSFRKKILEYSSHTSLEEVIDTTNFILLALADNKHIVYLDVPQILQLKEVVLSLFKEPTVY